MLIGIALLVAFLVIVVLIIRGQSPIIMLLLLAVLWADGAGTMVNLVQFGALQKLFPDIKYEAPYLTYWAAGMAVYILVAWLLEFAYLRKLGPRRMSAVNVGDGEATQPRKRPPYYTYIVP